MTKLTYNLLINSLIVSLLFGCSGESNKSEFFPGSSRHQPWDEVVFDENRALHDTLLSALTGISYPLHIYLPTGYEDSEQHYPVVYATDGQWIFEGFGKIIDSKQKDIILVAIEQGPNDRRATDYRLPGAKTYFDFLTSELLPYIEQQYRVNENERSLIGTSYGGILSGLALLMDDTEAPVFKNYLSFDPSFFQHQSATLEVEQARYNVSQQLHATLFITSATLRGNFPYVQWFTDLLRERQYEGLTIITAAYAVDHNDVANPSFASALDQLF